LDGEHDLRLGRSDVRGEVLHKVILGNPGEALRIDVEMRERRRRGSLRQQCPDRLAFVESESGDIDQTGDIWCVGAEGGHDLPPVRMADNNSRTVLTIEHLTEPSHVICQRALGKLGRNDVVSVSLEPFYDVAPTGAVRPCSVDENDVRF
jgi:hypothetical protein